jgi:hypothetical protein
VADFDKLHNRAYDDPVWMYAFDCWETRPAGDGTPGGRLALPHGINP